LYSGSEEVGTEAKEVQETFNAAAAAGLVTFHHEEIVVDNSFETSDGEEINEIFVVSLVYTRRSI